MGVSILIPAYRPTYLRQALASALTQDVDDLEILVSDDSGGDKVREVVEMFRDPRIVYSRTAGRIGATPNCTALWHAAKHDLIQFILDDDILMPHALPELLALTEKHPDASLYFGNRHIIDSQGKVTKDPASRGKPVIKLSSNTLISFMISRIANPIGEFNNVLMNRAVGLSPDLYTFYDGYQLRVVGDAAFYMRASLLGPVVGIDRTVAAFRHHGDQRSSPKANPEFAVGIAEWELFIRGEGAAGRVSQEDLGLGIERLGKGYRSWRATCPVLEDLLPGLEALGERVARGDRDLLDEAFKLRWEEFLVKALPPRD